MLTVLSWYALVMLTLMALLVGVVASQKVLGVTRRWRRVSVATRDRRGAREAAQA